ncbi:MAG: chorismate synthase [Candidatus Melainabacteria bacterium GWF2_32_7]|nr:MAG: chorismate synthase [Candidatus Melainabacteria bacterium GWF2_32_7]
MTFRFLTSGESHGKCLTAIIEGVPAGIELKVEDINKELFRRQQGYGRGGRMKIEQDAVIINSGVRHGITTGAPICLVIENKDWENWQVPMATQPIELSPANVDLIQQKKITHVRPGHADLPGALKYNHEDVRNVLERSSARETAIRVAVGAVASIILKNFNIEIFSHVLRIGSAAANVESFPDNYNIIKEFAEKSEVKCADYTASAAMRKVIDEAKESGDSLGGIFEVVALNVPVGLGSFVHWDRKLDGLIAQAIMSIPAIKSVNIGLGKASAQVPGSKLHDEIYPKEADSKEYQRKTNNSGGIEGGVSNGSPIIVRAAMKPIPTLKKPLKSINLENGKEHIAHYERSDVCAVPAAGVVGEAMLSIVLVKAFFEKFGGDSFAEIKANYENYCNVYQNR